MQLHFNNELHEALNKDKRLKADTNAMTIYFIHDPTKYILNCNVSSLKTLLYSHQNV